MSISIPDCYESIVGLTRSTCECYGEIPEDASDSLSGLYIDELVGLSFIQAQTNCDNNNDLFQSLKRSRDNAISAFQADTNALLLQNFRQRRQNFYGGIGRVQDNNTTLVDGDLYGVRMYCDNVKGGVLYIKQIGTLFKQTGQVELSVYNNLGDLVATKTLNTTANTHQQNTVDLELPLHSDYTEHLEYFFVYQYQDVLVPKVNDVKCSCGAFKPKYDCSHPYFGKQHETTYGWADWLMVGGLHFTTLPDFTDVSCTGLTTNNLMYGLTFNVELRCKIDSVLCDQQLDFEGNPLAGAMAIAIQNKSGEILGNWILQSGNLNRFTLIGAEQLMADVANFKATYEQMIQYIVQSVDITQNDCLACKDVYEMAKRGIFA